MNAGQQGIEVGTELEVMFGPYRAVAEVVELTERGAVLAYSSSALLVGYPDVATAPDGTELTHDRAHGFLGRAHFESAKVVGD